MPGPRTAPAWGAESGFVSRRGSSNAPSFPPHKDHGEMIGPLGESDCGRTPSVRSGVSDRGRQDLRGDVVGPAEGGMTNGRYSYGSYGRCPEGGARLRGIADKLRHPLADVRARAVSNLSGKISLGLVNPGDLNAEPTIFSDIVSLLQELVLPEVILDDRSSTQNGSAEFPSFSRSLLALCGRLAKDPSARARLLGEGAAEPLLRMVNSAETGGGSSTALAESARQVLGALGAPPDYHHQIASSDTIRGEGTEVVLPIVQDPRSALDTPTSLASSASLVGDHRLSAVVGGEGRGGVHEDEKGVQYDSAATAGVEYDPAATAGVSARAGKEQEEKQARALFGDGSGPMRWPRWTKDLVDGPSLPLSPPGPHGISSAAELIRCLKGGWRFPGVRLVRSEESALFDFEVRFRTASTEASLLACIRYLRDDVLEDYPAEVILQRHGTLGRLTSLLRAPSASEKILEEALSTAHRLFERLVYSARVHLDSVFQPPESPTCSTTGATATGATYDSGIANGAPATTTATATTTPFREAVPAAFPSSSNYTGAAQVSRGEVATATLLSFRYPQPTAAGPVPAIPAGAPSSALLPAYRPYAFDGDENNDDGPMQLLAGEGLSVCGALFAIFMSVCPLLSYGGGRLGGLKGNSSGGLGASRGELGSLSAGVLGGSGSSGSVVVAAAELLQTLLPFLLEPTPVGPPRTTRKQRQARNHDHSRHAEVVTTGAFGGEWGRSEKAPGLSGPLDSLRFQVMLSRMGCVLVDSGLINDHGSDVLHSYNTNENVKNNSNDESPQRQRQRQQSVGDRYPNGSRVRGATNEMEHGSVVGALNPLVNTVLSLILLLHPSGMAGHQNGNDDAFNDDDDGGGHGSAAGEAVIIAPVEVGLLLRGLVWSPAVAKHAPWIRQRLRPYLRAVDSMGEIFLEDAQALTMEAEAALHCEDISNSKGEEGPADTWEWVIFHLDRIGRSMQLLLAVEEPRIVGAAVALWASAAVAVTAASDRETQAKVILAERVGAELLEALIGGSFGEKACYQALEMLADLVGAGMTTGPTGLAITPRLATALIERGLQDPRLPFPGPMVAALALSLIVGDNHNFIGSDVRATSVVSSSHSGGGGGGGLTAQPRKAEADVTIRAASFVDHVSSEGVSNRKPLIAALVRRAATISAATRGHQDDQSGHCYFSCSAAVAAARTNVSPSLRTTMTATTLGTCGHSWAHTGPACFFPRTATATAAIATALIGCSCSALHDVLRSDLRTSRSKGEKPGLHGQGAAAGKASRVRDYSRGPRNGPEGIQQTGSQRLSTDPGMLRVDSRGLGNDPERMQTGSQGVMETPPGILRGDSRRLEADSVSPAGAGAWVGADLGGGAPRLLTSVSCSSAGCIVFARKLVPTLEAFGLVLLLLLSEDGKSGEAGKGEMDAEELDSDAFARLQKAHASVVALLDYIDAIPATSSSSSSTTRTPPLDGSTAVNSTPVGTNTHSLPISRHKILPLVNRTQLSNGSNKDNGKLVGDGAAGDGSAGRGGGGYGDDGDGGMASRLWSEVRHLCQANAPDRESAARRLWDMVVVKAIPAASSPVLFLPDPIGLSVDSGRLASSSNGETVQAAGAVSSGRYVGVSVVGARGRGRGFDGGDGGACGRCSGCGCYYDGPNNSVSRRPSLQPKPLPTFSLEHVRNLIDAAGSPALEVGLKMAAAEQLRGVLLAPGVASAVLQTDDWDRKKDDWDVGDRGGLKPSSLCAGVLHAASWGLLAVTSLSTRNVENDKYLRQPAATANIKKSEEVYLGLLWSAVWKLPPVRVSLAQGSSIVADGEAVAAAAVVTAVLRRLFDTRPSTRRLASRIAARVAFDAPTFFAVLSLSSSPQPSSWSSSTSYGGYDDSNVFGISAMVLVAYPRLRDWPSNTDASDEARTTKLHHHDQGISDRDMSLSGPTLALLPLVRSPAATGVLPGATKEAIVGGAGRSARVNDGHVVMRLRLAAGEWENVMSLRQKSGGELAGTRAREIRGVGATEVANRLAGELMGATRRSEFAAAIRKTRMWMLAGPGYPGAFFSGETGPWENAFQRFLQISPRSVNDRIALREVVDLLKTGVRYMSPRGLVALVNAAETCFTPTLSDTWTPPAGGLGAVYGDWNAATNLKMDTPREVEVKEALRRSMLELLVAIVVSPPATMTMTIKTTMTPSSSSSSSSSPDSQRPTAAFMTLAQSSLVPVILEEFLGAENDFGAAAAAAGRGEGRERRRYDDLRGNERRSTRARRLAIEFLAGLVRQCGSEATRIWSGIRSQHQWQRLGARNDVRRALAIGEGLEYDPMTGIGRSTSVLTQMVQVLARNASAHRAPDGFRGRSVLTASLLALQVILHSASSGSVPWKDGDQYRHVSGLLNLASHRDAAVRALALSVLTEFHNTAATAVIGGSTSEGNADDVLVGDNRGGDIGGCGEGIGGASQQRQEREMEEACVRAAGDEFHECPAVRVEALRFLCRHTAASCATNRRGEAGGQNLTRYALPLAVTLARAVPSLLSPPPPPPSSSSSGGKVTGGAAGHLSVAAGALRFIGVVVTAAGARTFDKTLDLDQLQGDEGARISAADKKAGEQSERDQIVSEQLKREYGGEGAEATAEGLLLLLKELWASQCLEACVHLLGETPRIARRGCPAPDRKNKELEPPPSSPPPPVGGWIPFVHGASVTLETSALRRAQATALSLLRLVVSCPPPPPLPPKSTPQVAPEAEPTTTTPPTPPPKPRSGGVALTVATSTAAAAAAAARDLRWSLLSTTPLVAGLVRCLIGVVEVNVVVGRNEEKQETVTETAMGEVMMGSSNDSRATFSIANAGASGAPAAPGVPSTSSPSSLRSRPVDDDRMRVAREACASLACLMTIQNNEDVGFGTRDLLFSATALASPDSAVIPGAVLDALENILCWSAAGTGAEWVEGIVSEAREMAKRVLLAMLSLSQWRDGLDLNSREAFRITKVLFEDEASVLAARPRQSWPQRQAERAADELRTRCLMLLLQCSDSLRELAISEGFMGEILSSLESCMGQIATERHGLDTLKNASRQLRLPHKSSSSTVRRKGVTSPRGGVVAAATVTRGRSRKSRGIARKSASSSPLSAGGVGGGSVSSVSGATASSRARQKRPLRGSGGGDEGATRISDSTNKNDLGDSNNRDAINDDGDDNNSNQRNNNNHEEGVDANDGEVCGRPEGVVGARGISVEKESPGEILEREFSAAAALMVAGMGDCRRAQAKCLELGLAQVLWKAWPLALASELSQTAWNHHRQQRYTQRRSRQSTGTNISTGGGAVGEYDTLSGEAGGTSGDGGGGGSLLLTAVLGLACALAKGFPEGKKAFVFAGPEGPPHGSAVAGGESVAGEWPRSSRSLLHRVASLALSASPTSWSDGASGSGPVYSLSASQAACDVVRSCCLAPECRVVLTQSGFFADLVGQLRQLYLTWGTRKGTPMFARVVRRAGDLSGILVNATLTPEGQKALLQVEGVGDLLGDLVDICIRATGSQQRRQQRTTNNVGIHPASSSRVGSPPPQRSKDGTSSPVPLLGPTPAPTPPTVVARTLLLYRNLALAPSTGQVAVHRDSLLNLIIRVLEHHHHQRQQQQRKRQQNYQRNNESEMDMTFSFAAASCLRAMVRGGSAEGGRKTAVGIGATRLVEVRAMVNSGLRLLGDGEGVGTGGGGGGGGGGGRSLTRRGRDITRLEEELLAVKALL